MILWLKRGTAAATFIFTIPLAMGCGTLWLVIPSALVNIGCAMSERFSPSVQRLLTPCVLLVNAIISTYAVVYDGPVAWAILASGSSLVSWNACLFLQRSPNASLSIQYRYLRRVGGMFVVGTIMGRSALALQGQFAPPFWLALFMMLTAGFLCLLLLSKTSLHGFEEKWHDAHCLDFRSGEPFHRHQQ